MKPKVAPMNLHSLYTRMLERKKANAQKQYFLPFRKTANKKAIVLVHGFTEEVRTWVPFAKLLMEESMLNEWDLYSIGYQSKVRLEVFSEASSLSNQADVLYSNLVLPPIGDYETIAFVAHSAGGLLVQRVLVDFQEILARTSHLFLFGTPSEGSHEARSWRFLNRQLSDLARQSPFIRELRTGWKETFHDCYPFHFEVIASADDEMVRLASVRKAFPGVKQSIVEGSHGTMIMPASAEAKVFQIVRNGLLTDPPRIPEVSGVKPDELPRSFISYSHKDSDWLMSIESVLFPLLGRGGIGRVWDDRRIEAGDLWEKEIKEAMECAEVAILLVTPSFLASSFIREIELPFLLERTRDKLRLLWVEIKAIDVEQAEFAAIRSEVRKFMAELNRIQAINNKKVLDDVPKKRIGQELRAIAEEIKRRVG